MMIKRLVVSRDDGDNEVGVCHDDGDNEVGVSRDEEDKEVGVSCDDEDKEGGVSLDDGDNAVGVSRDDDDKEVGVSLDDEDNEVGVSRDDGGDDEGGVTAGVTTVAGVTTGVSVNNEVSVNAGSKDESQSNFKEETNICGVDKNTHEDVASEARSREGLLNFSIFKEGPNTSSGNPKIRRRVKDLCKRCSSLKEKPVIVKSKELITHVIKQNSGDGNNGDNIFDYLCFSGVSLTPF